MKQNHIFTVALILALILTLLSGCYAWILPDAGVPLNTDYEEMEIYKNLRSAVTENSTLEEMLAAFEAMSAIPVDSYSNMFLYEVYAYELEGDDFLILHIVRQVDEPGTSEYIQLHLDIVYSMEASYAGFSECIWFDNDPLGFLQYIRKSEPYQALVNQPIHSRSVSIDSTW